MPPRRSIDLAVPPTRQRDEEPPENVLDFSAPPRLPFTLGPLAVFSMAERQRRRAISKAIALHARRARNR